MTSDIVGSRVHLRLFAPGDDSFGAKATGTITARVPKSPPRKFHDGYEVRLDKQIVIEDVAVQNVYVVPTGRYRFEEGKDKMSDLVQEPVYVMVSWNLPDGTAYTYGEKGTFAEVGLLQ